MRSEPLQFALMFVGTGVLIAWFDFILSNLDALDDSSDDFSDADARTAALANDLGGRPAAVSDRLGSGNLTRQRASVVTQGKPRNSGSLGSAN